MMGIVCSDEPLMIKWKWVLALRMPAKVFIINENADYFWLDREHLNIIRQFALSRAGLAGSGAVRTLARVFSFPFAICYLLLYAWPCMPAGRCGCASAASARRHRMCHRRAWIEIESNHESHSS